MNPVKTFKRIAVGGVQAVAVVSLLAACTDTLEDPRAVDAEPYADPGLVIDPPLGGDAPDDTIADAGLGDAGTASDAGDTGAEHDAGTPDSDPAADAGEGEDC